MIDRDPSKVRRFNELKDVALHSSFSDLCNTTLKLVKHNGKVVFHHIGRDDGRDDQRQ